jgi:hypothetical protein
MEKVLRGKQKPVRRMRLCARVALLALTLWRWPSHAKRTLGA